MSREEMEKIRATFEAFSRHDVEAIIDQGVHPDAEYKPAIASMDAEGGLYRGPDGIRRWARDLEEAVEDFHGELDELHDIGGGRYLGAGRFRGCGRASGAEFDVAIAWAWWMEDGLLRRWEAHFDSRDALDALGLESWPDG